MSSNDTVSPNSVNMPFSSAPFPIFDSEQETIIEFLERFSVQASDYLLQAGSCGKKKANILIKSLPVNVVTDLQRRLKPVKLSEATYDQLIDKLTGQFIVKKSIVGASIRLLNRKQGENETIEHYARVLNDYASECKYRDCCRDRMIRDAFISGLHSSTIVGGLLQDCELNEEKSFNDCVSKAKLLEQISQDAKDLCYEPKNTLQVNKMNIRKQEAAVPQDTYVCIRCGGRNHFANKCPIMDKTCSNCKKVGHLRKMCRSRNTYSSNNAAQHTTQARPSANQQAGYTSRQNLSTGSAANQHRSNYTSSQEPVMSDADSIRFHPTENEQEDVFYNFLG